MVGLIAHPAEHIVDRGLVCAGLGRVCPLPRGPRSDKYVAANPHACLGRQGGCGIETLRRPVWMRARVAPGKHRDPVVVERRVVGIDGHPWRVLVLARRDRRLSHVGIMLTVE